MGTVHGVYLKYVGLSAISYVGYSKLLKDPTTGTSLSFWNDIILRHIVASSSSSSRRLVSGSTANDITLIRSLGICILGYSFLVNGIIAILFKLEKGMFILGKDRRTGQIPLWSKILFFPFHLPTLLYTHVHIISHKDKVPVATEVQPGWWVGSCYGHELNKQWAGVIDLTVEFPESTIATTKSYLSIPTWDGVPPSPEQLDEAANFAVAAVNAASVTGTTPDILVHCAHGRGRSTTVMCACLVKVGLYETWQDAFDKGIKPSRTVCKLNTRMKQALTEWQNIYITQPRYKKGQ